MIKLILVTLASCAVFAANEKASEMLIQRRQANLTFPQQKILENKHLQLVLGDERTTATDIIIYLLHTSKNSEISIDQVKVLMGKVRPHIGYADLIHNSNLSPVILEAYLDELIEKTHQNNIAHVVSKFEELKADQQVYLAFQRLIKKIAKYRLLLDDYSALSQAEVQGQKNTWKALFQFSSKSKTLYTQLRNSWAKVISTNLYTIEDPLETFYNISNVEKVTDEFPIESVSPLQPKNEFNQLIDGIIAKKTKLSTSLLEIIVSKSNVEDDIRYINQNIYHYLFSTKSGWDKQTWDQKRRALYLTLKEVISELNGMPEETLKMFKNKVWIFKLPVSALSYESLSMLIDFYNGHKYAYEKLTLMLKESAHNRLLTSEQITELGMKMITNLILAQKSSHLFETKFKTYFPFYSGIIEKKLPPRVRIYLAIEDLADNSYVEGLTKLQSLFKELSISNEERASAVNSLINKSFTMFLDVDFSGWSYEEILSQRAKWAALAKFIFTKAQRDEFMMNLHQIVSANVNNFRSPLRFYFETLKEVKLYTPYDFNSLYELDILFLDEQNPEAISFAKMMKEISYKRGLDENELRQLFTNKTTEVVQYLASDELAFIIHNDFIENQKLGIEYARSKSYALFSRVVEIAAQTNTVIRPFLFRGPTELSENIDKMLDSRHIHLIAKLYSDEYALDKVLRMSAVYKKNDLMNDTEVSNILLEVEKKMSKRLFERSLESYFPGQKEINYKGLRSDCAFHMFKLI